MTRESIYFAYLIEHGEIPDQTEGWVNEGRWFVQLIKKVTDPSKEVPTQLYKTEQEQQNGSEYGYEKTAVRGLELTGRSNICLTEAPCEFIRLQ